MRLLLARLPLLPERAAKDYQDFQKTFLNRTKLPCIPMMQTDFQSKDAPGPWADPALQADLAGQVGRMASMDAHSARSSPACATLLGGFGTKPEKDECALESEVCFSISDRQFSHLSSRGPRSKSTSESARVDRKSIFSSFSLFRPRIVIRVAKNQSQS